MRSSAMWLCPSQQVEIVKLIPVFHDVALDLGGIHPGDEVFEVPAKMLAQDAHRH